SGALSAVPALAMPPCPRQAPRPPFEVAPSLQVTVLADPSDSRPVVGALVAEPAVADLSTPPCPRQAPRPPAALVPSLQVTVAPVAARARPPENIVATNSAEVTRSIRIYSSCGSPYPRPGGCATAYRGAPGPVDCAPGTVCVTRDGARAAS